jgi:hypothetical protein
MDIYFDESILNNIFNNSEMTDELCACISAVIDSELEKSDSEIDFDYIDECSNMLLDIQSKDISYTKILPILNSDKFIESTKKLAKGGVIKFAKIGIAAAVVFTSVLTANAAVGSITGKTIVEHIIGNDNKTVALETVTTQRAGVKRRSTPEVSVISEADKDEIIEVSSVVYEPETEKSSVVYEEEPTTHTTTAHHDSAEEYEKRETTTQAPTVLGLDAVIIHSVFKTEYIIGEEFSSNGLYLIASYSDSTRKTIDISECDISGFDSSAAGLCRVSISYKGNAAIIEITVKEKETTTQSENEDEENI